MSKKLSIEFLGSPGSGKSYYHDKLVAKLNKKKINLYDFQNLFLNYYPGKLSFNQIIKFKTKKNLTNSKNYLIKYLNRIFDQIISFDNEINHILKSKKKKFFLKNYFELLHSNKNVHNFLSQKLLKWLRNEISGISIYKKFNKKNLILINSEGINQRLSRLNYFNSKIEKIKKLNYRNFESDIIIFVDTNIKKCKERINKRNNINYSEKDLIKFKTACKNIYLISKKKKFIIKNKKDFQKVCNKIEKIFYEN
tara:strand:+ start:22554 stop:23309 length:756 start_codon:yes stop_codon:yes gene_type:complete